MKAMPVKDLVKLVMTYGEDSIVSKDKIERVFDNYGDDYFASEGDHTKMELTNVNKDRIEFIDVLEGKWKKEIQ